MSASGGQFDVFAPGASWLHRLDPRVKLAFIAAAIVLTFLWVNLFLLGLMILTVHLTLLSVGYPLRLLRTIWRAVLPLVILVILVWPIFDSSGEVWFRLGPLTVTFDALLRGSVTALRIATVSFVVIIWIGTTDTRELVRGFVRLGLPVPWGMSLTIGLRFIPTYLSAYQTVLDAQRSRGLVMAGNALKKARQMMPVFVASLVSALRTSEQLAMTLEARGFGASKRRTAFRDIRMDPFDWLALGLVAVSFVALVVLTFWVGLGQDLTSIVSV